MRGGREVTREELLAACWLTVGQTAAAVMMTPILSLPHSAAASLFGLTRAPLLWAEARPRKPGTLTLSVAPGTRGLPASVAPGPQTLTLAQTLQALEPKEKPASQQDSHIPSGWNAFIWPGPVGRAVINSLHTLTKKPIRENNSSTILRKC